MKLELKFARNITNGGIVAYLIDASVPTGYPSNFICVFPIHLNMESNYEKLFGEKRGKMALQLLNAALKNPEYRDNEEIKAEIAARKAYLTSKRLMKTKCQNCGELFEYVKLRYPRRFCDRCKDAKKS
jgi:predicted Zn-ribbon and HTH transcriptional regulator